jgi:hypothetical protein
MGEKRSAYWATVGKSKGKRLLGRRKRRWDKDIAVDVKIHRMGGLGVNSYVTE